MNKHTKTFGLWVIIFLVMMLAFREFDPQKDPKKSLDFSSFISQVKEGHVEQVSFTRPDIVKGKYKATFQNGEEFSTIGNLDNGKMIKADCLI